MALYKFKAIKDQNEEIIAGTLEAENDAKALASLRQDYASIVSLEEVDEEPKEKKKWQFFSAKTVKISQKAMFFRKLYMLISAGLTNAEALEILQGGEENPVLRGVIGRLLARVKKGDSLSLSASNEPKFFGANVLALLQVGDETGHMEEALCHIADYFDEVAETRKNLSSALAYPIFLLLSFFLVFFVIIFYCVPSFERAFAPIIKSGNLPLATKAIFATSNFLCNHYIVFALCLVTPIIIVCYKFRGKWNDKLYLVPLFRKSFTAEAMRNMSLLLGANIPAARATSLLSQECGAVQLRRIFSEAAVAIDKGEAIDKALGKHFSAMDRSLLAVGVTGAKLAEVCLIISEQYKREAEAAQKKILSLLEPSLVLLIGLMVALLAFGIYLPCIRMIEQISM